MARPRGFPKTGGRKLGTPNKKNVDQVERIESLCEQYNFDPLRSLFEIATDKSILLELRISVLKEITQYVYSKRKSIEIDNFLDPIAEPQIHIFLPDNETSKD